MSGHNASLVVRSWGATAPAWVLALAAECDRSSQVQAARRIGYSPSAVNCVLKKAYQGATHRIQQVVEDRLMQAEVACPFFGQLLRTRCQEILAGQGSTSVRRSCRVCKNNPSRRILNEQATGGVHEAKS
ncbi:MAG: hypothetical protein HQL98_15510 [Magnetococcales bacterium]|nr:hypothetical protein [Magnetococcales bacterium]